jgi:ferric-dicitrate binding protein FerR (iron transport regulator)
MSEQHNSTKGDPSEGTVAALLKFAGERASPRAQAMEGARAAAEAAWQRSLHEHRRSRQAQFGLRWVAAAAFLSLVVASLVLLERHGQTSPALVAHVASATGEAKAFTEVGAIALQPDQPLLSGTRVQTTQGKLALRLGSLSLRLNAHTSIELDAADRIRLVEGIIYVDSGGLNTATALAIETPAGKIRHQGTQFLVEVSEQATRVSVREGRISLEGGRGESVRAVAGESVRVTATQVELQKNVPGFGPMWEWVGQVAPTLNIENRPLTEFLSWISREQGWQVRYASEDYERSAPTIRLHGTIERLNADEMLERVSMVTGISLGAREGVLLVGHDDGARR